METRIEIQQYIPALRPEWDCFIANSRNGTFLFFRNYMDYHSDRFIDNSLLFRYKGKLIAVLPANREGDVLWSHQGLTYGGLVLSSKYMHYSGIMRGWLLAIFPRQFLFRAGFLSANCVVAE